MDLQEVFKQIDSAEVICFHFPYLRKTLIVDPRADVEDPPLVKLVAMAKSAEERLRSLKTLRPRFPKPEKVVIVPGLATSRASKTSACGRNSSVGWPPRVTPKCRRPSTRSWPSSAN